MTKKLFALTLCLCLLLCGCQNVPAQSTEPEASPTDTETQDTVTLDIGLEIASCTIYNADGKKLVLPENGIIQADMEYTEVENQAPGPGYLGRTFAVPYSQSFTFDIESITGTKQNFYPGLMNYLIVSYCNISVSGLRMSSVTFEASDKVSITGNDMELTLITGTEDWSCSIDASAQETVTVQKTNTGVLIEGFKGRVVFTSTSATAEHIFTGEAAEIDVVSQPGEILITPVEG